MRLSPLLPAAGGPYRPPGAADHIRRGAPPADARRKRGCRGRLSTVRQVAVRWRRPAPVRPGCHSATGAAAGGRVCRRTDRPLCRRPWEPWWRWTAASRASRRAVSGCCESHHRRSRPGLTGGTPGGMDPKRRSLEDHESRGAARITFRRGLEVVRAPISAQEGATNVQISGLWVHLHPQRDLK